MPLEQCSREPALPRSTVLIAELSTLAGPSCSAPADVPLAQLRMIEMRSSGWRVRARSCWAVGVARPPCVIRHWTRTECFRKASLPHASCVVARHLCCH
eukprot:453899-Prymnesium_polylepis.3